MPTKPHLNGQTTIPKNLIAFDEEPSQSLENSQADQLAKESALRIGFSLPSKSYDPSKDNPLCASGRALANDLRPIIPGASRPIDHQTAAVERHDQDAHEAKLAAYTELLGDCKRLLERAAIIRLRQPEYLQQLQELERQRIPLRQKVAVAAAHLGIVIDPTNISIASITKALGKDEDYGPGPVPVPGAPSKQSHIAMQVFRAIAPFFLGIPTSLALGTITGVIPLAALQDLENASGAMWSFVICAWLIGSFLDHMLMAISDYVGILHARAKFEGHVPNHQRKVSLRAAAFWATGLMTLVSIIVALLDATGLREMAIACGWLDDTEVPSPLVFFFIGSAITGAILLFGTLRSYVTACRELSENWPWKREVTPRPATTEEEKDLRRGLMESACELIDLNTKVAQVESKIQADQAALAERPQISALALERIREEEEKVAIEGRRLRKLMEYTCRRFGLLHSQIDMGEFEIPTKMVLLPLQKMWLHIRGEKRDDWPAA